MLEASKHFEARAKQRGYRSQDIAFIAEHGTQTANGLMLTNHDVVRLEAELKIILQTAHRLKNVFIPCSETTLKTIFFANKLQQKKFMASCR